MLGGNESDSCTGVIPEPLRVAHEGILALPIFEFLYLLSKKKYPNDKKEVIQLQREKLIQEHQVVHRKSKHMSHHQTTSITRLLHNAISNVGK